MVWLFAEDDAPRGATDRPSLRKSFFQVSGWERSVALRTSGGLVRVARWGGGRRLPSARMHLAASLAGRWRARYRRLARR
eukprot:15044719-Alexandrium_andersonii.AAC.1